MQYGKHLPTVSSKGVIMKYQTIALFTAIMLATVPAQAKDFGKQTEQALKAQSRLLFGIVQPLAASAAESAEEGYRTTTQKASDQVALAKGLKAEYLTREAAELTDMMAFWPLGNSPTHLITCVEGGVEADIGNGKRNPSIQSINLSNGAVATLTRGMDRCDGIRTTPWGTILATEETTGGGAYELLLPTNPETFTEITVTDRGAAGAAASIVYTGTVEDATAKFIKRTALPAMAWEGLEVLPSSVVIGGDELRPSEPSNEGGAIFKFVPATARASTATIADLADSPLVSGSTYAMRVMCESSGSKSGQGCEVGNAVWVAVDATEARSDAMAAYATGYYRPEDLHLDPLYSNPEDSDAIRFCWTNTGNEGAKHYGEVVCGIDSAPLTADSATRSVVVNRFVEGDTDFNAVDNLAFQPVTGNLYVIEDHDNGDIFACLPDGADRDIKTDGCVKVLSVKDTGAEPTGFLFSPDGTTAYVSIQHSNDDNMSEVDGYPTDDVLVITGFKLKGVNNQ
jgi:secreted PhoX family phosphatase